jgi:antitoxin ParD1/3/4
MANVEKLSIALTPEMATVVREAVSSGEYASSSEVVREALRDWQRKRALERKELEEIRELWNQGLNSGVSRFSTVQEIKAEARRRFEKDNKTE